MSKGTVKYRVGDRVRTVEWEGMDSETGTIMHIDYVPWGTSIVLVVDKRLDMSDDRLRELTADQIKEKL